MTATPAAATATMSVENYREILETKRFDIVQCLNCERTLMLSHLRSQQVFDEEDCELILAERVNRARVGKLVDFLARKGPKAYQHFLDVVQIENSSLYETLTGTKSTSKPSELMRQIAGHQIKTEGVSGFQVQLLAEHLQRTYADLQDIAKKYGELVKAKQEIEEQLVRAEKNLEFEIARREKFEEEIVMSKVEFDEDVEQNESLLLTECDNLQRGVADRDVYIIVLQMKLLAEKEECDRLRSKLDLSQQKSETMARELRRISDNYDQERRQSIKLSQCIRIQVDEIEKIDEMKKRLRESKFENILVREERDCIAEELKELKKWAEALTARFDVIEKEKDVFVEKNAFVTNNCTNLQETVRTLQRKLILSRGEVEDCHKRNKLLANDSEIFKKQRDCALQARKEAILERDKAMSEKDTVQKQCNELQLKRDQINEERAALIQDYDAMKVRYNLSLDELAQIKKRVNEKELEAEDLSRRLDELEEKNRRNTPMKEEESSESESESTCESGGEGAAKDNPWKERRLKSLLKSMKHRISGDRLDADISPESGTLHVLQCLLPNLNSRPYKILGPNERTTVTRTLQRQMGQRKLRSNTTGVLSVSTDSENKSTATSLPTDIRRSDVVDFLEAAERDIPDDVSRKELDGQPLRSYFRARARCVSKRYIRSKSAGEQLNHFYAD